MTVGYTKRIHGSNVKEYNKLCRATQILQDFIYFLQENECDTRGIDETFFDNIGDMIEEIFSDKGLILSSEDEEEELTAFTID